MNKNNLTPIRISITLAIIIFLLIISQYLYPQWVEVENNVKRLIESGATKEEVDRLKLPWIIGFLLWFLPAALAFAICISLAKSLIEDLNSQGKNN